VMKYVLIQSTSTIEGDVDTGIDGLYRGISHVARGTVRDEQDVVVVLDGKIGSLSSM